MDWLRTLTSRILGVFGAKQARQELDAEVREHLGMLIKENRERGMSENDARAAALRSFGGVEQTRELYRDQRGLPWLDTFWQDVRFGFRMLRKNPGFTSVAVLTLALGVGVNTSVFGLMEAVLLRNLPVRHPEELAIVGWDVSKWPRGIRQSGYGDSLAFHLYQDLRDHNAAFSDLFGFAPLGFDSANTTVTVDGQTTLQDGVVVTGNFFSALGVQPAAGRVINDADDTPGSARVAVLSYDYWSRRFGRDPQVIGRAISVNNMPAIVVGIAPLSFLGVLPGRRPDLWVSISDGRGLAPFGSLPDKKSNLLTDDLWFWLQTMGRLKPGVSLAQAQISFDTSFRGYVRSSYLPGTPESELPHVKLRPGEQGMEMLRRAYGQPLRLLQIMVAMVLLIACANLGALLLARAAARRTELGIRFALGASRARLIRQMLVENFLLAAAGAALALLFAQWGARVLYLLLSTGGLPSAGGRPIGLDVRIDAAVFGFALVAAFLVSLLAGLIPAIRATRLDLASVVKDASRGAAGGHDGQPWIRRALVFTQITLSVMLLSGAGLFLQTLRRLNSQDLGFRRDHLLLFELNPVQNGYDRTRLINLYAELLERLPKLPGVQSASASGLAMISGWINNGPASADSTPSPRSHPPYILSNSVGPRFLETMGIPLLFGRDLEPRDLREAPRVAVINQTMAQTFWPRRNPLGHQFSFSERFDPTQAFEVIGVAQDAKFAKIREKIQPTCYFPFTQTSWPLGEMYFEVRTAGDSLSVVPSIREIVRSLDPGLPLANVKTQVEQVDETLVQERLFARLSAAFAALAIVLACIGLYGLLAYAVARRTHEIGVRMALGAVPRSIMNLVLAEGLWLAVCGSAAGIAGALASGRLIRGYLFGVTPHDPWTLVSVVALLFIVALAACIVPARRATRVDPLVALRCE